MAYLWRASPCRIIWNLLKLVEVWESVKVDIEKKKKALVPCDRPGCGRNELVADPGFVLDDPCCHGPTKLKHRA